jgi:glycosyltransferase involved in cell wall biosynthesis
MPRISVIVPVYNAYAFIDRCIISIVQQSFSDFEAIFVDDCSEDRSASMVRQFARNDSRITLSVHKKNRGPGAARNTGVAMARGDYVTFVDSDDFIEPNLFENMVEASGAGKFDIVETGCQAVDGKDNILWDYTPSPMKISQLGADPKNMFLIREWGMTQKLWRRSLFQSDVTFPEGVFWEDIAVVPALIVDARSLNRIDYIGYNYLQRSDSITNSRSIKHVQDLFAAFDYFIAHLRKRNLLAQYQGVLSHLIESRVEYFVKHMRSNFTNDPQEVDRLVQLCEELAAEYLAKDHGAEHTKVAWTEFGLGRISSLTSVGAKKRPSSGTIRGADGQHVA